MDENEACHTSDEERRRGAQPPNQSESNENETSDCAIEKPRKRTKKDRSPAQQACFQAMLERNKIRREKERKEKMELKLYEKEKKKVPQVKKEVVEEDDDSDDDGKQVKKEKKKERRSKKRVVIVESEEEESTDEDDFDIVIQRVAKHRQPQQKSFSNHPQFSFL